MTNRYKVIEILQQVTIRNTDGTTNFYNNIYVTNKGIHIGKIKINPKPDLSTIDIRCGKKKDRTCFNAYEEFVKNGYKSRDNILSIHPVSKSYILTKL